MEYVVKHYFPVKGGLLTPGEIVRDLPEEIIPRLLEKGAIEEIAPASPAESVKPVKSAKTPKAAEAVKAEEVEEEYEDAESEALEIDPMDAIVAAPEETPKKTTRKKSAKKEG